MRRKKSLNWQTVEADLLCVLSPTRLCRSEHPLAQLYCHSTLEHHHFDQCLMVLNSPVSAQRGVRRESCVNSAVFLSFGFVPRIIILVHALFLFG